MPRILSAEDNYADFRQNNIKLPMCPTCLVIFEPYGHGFPGKSKPKYDLSITTEHMHLASPKLKEFLQEVCTSPLQFFETGGGYFMLLPEREVVLDMRGSFIEATALCKTCGEPNGVYSNIDGEVEILDGQQSVGPMDMVRSRQRTGERRQRAFYLVIGDKLVEELRERCFSGLGL